MFIFFLDHPFPYYIPFADYRETPWFQIIYFFEIWICFSVYLSYCSTGNIFLSTINFGIIRIRILQYNLRNLSSINGKEDEKLQKCYEDHVAILKQFKSEFITSLMIIFFTYFRYINGLNNVFTYGSLYEFVCFSVVLCTLILMIASVNILFYLLIILMLIFSLLHINRI